MPYKDLAARRAYERARYAKNPGARAARLTTNYAWVKANREQRNAIQRSYTRKLKRAVLDHYGGVCACCGEDEIAFLAIDHINGGGNQLRSNGSQNPRGGADLYGWLRRNNYPGGYQVLCHNCNFGKHVNGGICPHQARIDP
jgi:hypothetical protein